MLRCTPLIFLLIEEEFEDTKGVIRISLVNQTRTDNSMDKRKRQRDNNDLQDITHKTKDRVTRTLKTV